LTLSSTKCSGSISRNRSSAKAGRARQALQSLAVVRFIQSPLRVWAYGILYHHSTERATCSNAGPTITTGTAPTNASEASHP
jgi:hypothetical protein